MSSTVCLAGPPFSITGANQFQSNRAEFHLSFDSNTDEQSVITVDWYINQILILNQNNRQISIDLPCGNHIVSSRLLTSAGWSGIKSFAFATCAVPVLDEMKLVSPELLSEGNLNVPLQVIAYYTDGSSENITNQFIFSSSIGTFTGNLLTVPNNTVIGDDSNAIIIATKGSIQLTKTIPVLDKTVLSEIVIEGPAEVNEGANNIPYIVKAVFSNGLAKDITREYVLSSTIGTFADGNKLSVPHDTSEVVERIATIKARKSELDYIEKSIRVINQTVAIGLEFVGDDKINEGDTLVYYLHKRFTNGLVLDVTADYTYSIDPPDAGTISVVNNKISLHVPINDLVDPVQRALTLKAKSAGNVAAQKDITIIDGTKTISILVLDIYDIVNLDVIALIDTTGVAESHQAAYTSNNIIPPMPAADVSEALILASDLVQTPNSSLKWRFEFNIGRLIKAYPAISTFTFYIKGKGTPQGQINGQYATKKFGSKLKLSGSPGSYVPTTEDSGYAVPIVWNSTLRSVSTGFDTVHAEAALHNIIRFDYTVSVGVNQDNLQITTY